MNAPVFAFGDLAADGFFIVNLTSIGAEIIPLRIRIFGDAHIGSTDIPMRVALMVHRYRKLQHVALVALYNIIEDRPAFNVSGLDKVHVFHAVMVGSYDISLALVLQGQAQSQGYALDGGELAVQRLVPLRIAWHFVEENRRRLPLAPLGKHLGNGTHLSVPMGAIYFAQFAQLINLIQPIPQTAVSYSIL